MTKTLLLLLLLAVPAGLAWHRLANADNELEQYESSPR